MRRRAKRRFEAAQAAMASDFFAQISSPSQRPSEPGSVDGTGENGWQIEQGGAAEDTPTSANPCERCVDAPSRPSSLSTPAGSSHTGHALRTPSLGSDDCTGRSDQEAPPAQQSGARDGSAEVPFDSATTRLISGLSCEAMVQLIDALPPARDGFAARARQRSRTIARLLACMPETRGRFEAALYVRGEAAPASQASY